MDLTFWCPSDNGCIRNMPFPFTNAWKCLAWGNHGHAIDHNTRALFFESYNLTFPICCGPLTLGSAFAMA